MPTITIKAKLSKKDLLEAAQQLTLSKLEGFVQVEYLAQLAQFCRISLTDLMTHLGIKPPING